MLERKRAMQLGNMATGDAPGKQVPPKPGLAFRGGTPGRQAPSPSKKGGVSSKTIAMLLMFALTASIIMLLFVSFYSELGMDDEVPPTTIVFDDGLEDECISGQTMECTADSGCPGEKSCLHGSWSRCTAYSVCTPGEERFCSTHTCTSGVQACNDCGQWGRCTLQ